jgi:hypothetical protein
MNKIFASAKRLQNMLDEAGLPNCFIGGVAVQRWGEMRLTEDADAAIATALGTEPRVLDLLGSHYEFRVQRPLDIVRVHRVVLLREPGSQIELDVSLAASGFEVQAIERATPFDFSEDGSLMLRTCSAEDLILYKAVASRDIDWHDIRGILIRQGENLDFDRIDRDLLALTSLKEAPEIVEQWQQLKARYV